MKQTMYFSFVLAAFLTSTGIFAQNQSASPIGKPPVRAAQEKGISTNTKTSLAPAPEKSVQANGKAPKPKSVSSNMTREATIALYNEITQQANNPAYNRKAALERLYTSPFVNRGLNKLDDTFPIQILTGDKELDRKTYMEMKSTWIAQHPERYAAVKTTTK